MDFLIPARLGRPSDDPIFALNAEAQARRAKGESIVNATVGALLDDDGKLGVMPTVLQVLREVPLQQAAGYAPIAGPAPFREGAVKELLGGTVFEKHAVAVATSGGTGALRHAGASFTERGNSILTTSLHWGPYETIADEDERGLETFEMFDDKGGLNVPAYEAALRKQVDRQGRALVFLNDPCQNPTGYSMSDDEWRAFVAATLNVADATKKPITICVDNAYYMYGAGDPRSHLPQLEPLLGHVQLCFAWSASKSYAQYGARVGALIVVDPDPVSRKHTVDSLVYSCRGTWSNCNHAGMLAIGRILNDPELMKKVDAERAVLHKLLDGRVAAFNAAGHATHLRYPRYDGGFFTTVFTPKDKDPKALCEKLKELGIFIVPVPGALRVGLCSVPERDIPRLVEGLAKVTL